jgi:hypothetical protein
MISSEELMVAALMARAPIGGVGGAEADYIIQGKDVFEGYQPVDGPLILVANRGGSQDHSGAVQTRPMQFITFGLTEAIAEYVDRALYDALENLSTFRIRAVNLDVAGELQYDDDTEWPFYLSLYTAVFINS